MADVPVRTRKRRGGKRSAPGLNGPDKQIISAEVQEKRKKALELRKQKMTYDAIASVMGLSTPMMAWRYVNDALKAIPMETAIEVKQLEIEDCRADLLRLNQRLAAKGLSVAEEVKALTAKAKLREQLARYLGLYAPVRTELTGKDGAPLALTMADIQGMTDEQLERAIAGVGRGSGARGAGAGEPQAAPGSPRQAH